MDLKRRGAFLGAKRCFGSLLINLVVCVCQVSCIEVSAPEEITAVRGETVTLSCYFTSTSRSTSHLSVDWSYRPQTGGPSHLFFHFSSSVVYPPKEGQFKGRVRWLGVPSAGDASIQLLNSSLTDNGTFTCRVLNLPDLHGQPAQTLLTVTPKKLGVRFSDVAVLLLFVLLPSGLMATVLLMRMFCCSNAHKHSLTRHSPIEVTDGEEYMYKQPPPKHKPPTCWQLYLQDSYDEEYYHHYDKQYKEALAESQC